MLRVHVGTNMRMNEGSVCMVGGVWWFEKQHLSKECTTLCVVWKHLAVIILTVLCRVTLRCANCLNVLISVVLNVSCHSILKGKSQVFSNLGPTFFVVCYHDLKMWRLTKLKLDVTWALPRVLHHKLTHPRPAVLSHIKSLHLDAPCLWCECWFNSEVMCQICGQHSVVRLLKQTVKWTKWHRWSCHCAVVHT